MASEKTFSDWYFAFSKERNRTPCQEEVWNAALASPQEAPPAAGAAQAPSSFVNAAGILASDKPATVVRKLDRAFHDAVTFAATPSPEVAEQQGEREAFEASILRRMHIGKIERARNGEYWHSGTQDRWETWMDRAALASRAAPQAGKLGDGATIRCRKCGEQNAIEFNSARIVTHNRFTGKPRDARDIQSDPEGKLIVDPGKPLRAAPQASGDDETKGGV